VGLGGKWHRGVDERTSGVGRWGRDASKTEEGTGDVRACEDGSWAAGAGLGWGERGPRAGKRRERSRVGLADWAAGLDSWVWFSFPSSFPNTLKLI